MTDILLIQSGSKGNELFGSIIKTLRRQNNMTAMEVSERANVHVSFIRGIERGVQAPSRTVGAKILKAVGATCEMRWEDDPEWDVRVIDPEDPDCEHYFKFKAAKKGQNSRVASTEPGDKQVRMFCLDLAVRAVVLQKNVPLERVTELADFFKKYVDGE